MRFETCSHLKQPKFQGFEHGKSKNNIVPKKEKMGKVVEENQNF